jgi:hypothetical protein
MTLDQAIEYALENLNSTVIASEAKQSPSRDVEIASHPSTPLRSAQGARNDTRQV